jgi:hypothetical protein
MLPFKGVRVTEIGGGTAPAFCGKLFADFDAKADPHLPDHQV